MNPIVTYVAPSATLQMLQLALVFVFLTSYALALGSFCTARGRWRAAGIALLSLGLFSATVTPWAMGIVWAALAVGAMGAFVAVTVVTSRVLKLDGRRVVLPPPVLDEERVRTPLPRAPVAAVTPACTVTGTL